MDIKSSLAKAIREASEQLEASGLVMVIFRFWKIQIPFKIDSVTKSSLDFVTLCSFWVPEGALGVESKTGQDQFRSQFGVPFHILYHYI
jgi:hypothetical protein